MRQQYEPKINKHGFFVGHGWFEIPSWNINFYTPPKVGSSTVRHFLRTNNIECSYISFHQVRTDLYENCVVVRDPIERFKSTWRNKCRDIIFQSDGTLTRLRKHLHNRTPEELMSMIEGGYKNIHLSSQTLLLNNVDATLIPLPQLTDWWRDRGYGDLESETANVTDKDDTVFTDDLIQRVLTFYTDDVKLYERACTKQ